MYVRNIVDDIHEANKREEYHAFCSRTIWALTAHGVTKVLHGQYACVYTIMQLDMDSLNYNSD